ncbi:hypothetical protein ALQ44_01741 [Pseudomonas syringae pv. pisi]|uniref:Uncharacterized protein n=1 Tax=Pseudomonas syringae pv. pisi TaxID=59510 RepID=A0A3M3ULA7_PSESJ|nr:hypothetical protein ALQ44_01741 [Pseudomonas syringae pv. pisi]
MPMNHETFWCLLHPVQYLLWFFHGLHSRPGSERLR